MATDFDAISSVIVLLSIGSSWFWVAVLLSKKDNLSLSRCLFLLNALLIVLGLAILMSGFGF